MPQMTSERRIAIATMSANDLANALSVAGLNSLTPDETSWASTCLDSHTQHDDDDLGEGPIDAWHSGWAAGNHGHPLIDLSDPNYIRGWHQGNLNRIHANPIITERPEGYYHMPLEQ